MASTNKTTNYELSQFLGTDKPAWLSDYNTDMSKIDTQMKANADTATGADGKADANATAIGTLSNLTTDVKTSIVGAVNEINTKTTTAQNTANNASTTASTANTKADGLTDYLNLSVHSSYAYNDANIQKYNGNTTGGVLNIARNTTGSLCKIYGRMSFSATNAWTSNTGFKINTDTGLRPTETITISSGATAFSNSGANLKYAFPVNIILNTDGTIEFRFTSADAGDNIQLFLSPCIYFVTDFGDLPE